jgi:pilus assembly protein Flp/PilA
MDSMLYINEFISDEQAVTAIEYGLLAALIAVAVIGGLNATGASVTAIYNFWTAAVMAAIAGAL